MTRIVKAAGFVNADPLFAEHPQAINACSDLLVGVFGEWRHARSAIGVGSTPEQIPLEIEAIVEFSDS